MAETVPVPPPRTQPRERDTPAAPTANKTTRPRFEQLALESRSAFTPLPRALTVLLPGIPQNCELSEDEDQEHTWCGCIVGDPIVWGRNCVGNASLNSLQPSHNTLHSVTRWKIVPHLVAFCNEWRFRIVTTLFFVAFPRCI